MPEIFTLNFTSNVLGAEAALRLKQHKVTQTLRAGTGDIIKAIINRELRAGDALHIALDRGDMGLARLTRCELVPAVGLTNEDAQRGGFNTVEELQVALKRAGYRFKPLIDYMFYRVQFVWISPGGVK